MTGRCNAGTTVTKMKLSYGDFQVWLNKKGVANLISVSMMEASGYILSTHTHADWVVTTPEGKDITFKRDKGVCTGMPYINIRDQKEGLVMIETVRDIIKTNGHIFGDIFTNHLFEHPAWGMAYASLRYPGQLSPFYLL